MSILKASRFAFLTVLLALSLALASGCGKNAEEEKKDEASVSETGLTDQELKDCAVGVWLLTFGDDSIEVTLNEDGTLAHRQTGTASFTVEQGTWSIEDGILVSTTTHSGTSATSIEEAEAAVAEKDEADQELEKKGFACKGNQLSTETYVGGDPATLVGAWKTIKSEEHFKIDGEFVLKESDETTLTLAEDGTGTNEDVETDYYDGTNALTEPEVETDTSAVCSWSKTDTVLSSVRNGDAASCGTGDVDQEQEYFTIGNVLAFFPLTKQE